MSASPEEKMLVEQVMHDNPETLTPEHRLKDALPVYERHGVNCVPILDGQKRVRGILTVFQLVQAVRQGKSFDTPIGEVMDCIGLRFFGHVFVDQAAMFTASFWMARTADGVL